MRAVWPLLAATALSQLAFADEIVSPAPDSVQVTIYRDPDVDLYEPLDQIDYQEFTGLAMVTETRTLSIPQGSSTLVFQGVADAIVPQTAAVDGLPAIVLESNFDYDLLSPGAIIAKSLGRSVTLVRTDETTGRVTRRHAILRSGPTGIVLDIDGTIEVLGCSGLVEKLVFDSLPEGLADQPTLSMKIEAKDAGEHTIQLSYLALGLNWAADYVATIDPDGRTLNLTGWITLVNRSATTFANAPTEVVAGELARTPDDTQPPGPTEEMLTPACWPIGSFESRDLYKRVTKPFSAPPAFAIPQMMARTAEEVVVTGLRESLDAKQSELGDYKLYSLPHPTTIAARQSKQVRFLNQTKVPFERLYTYRLDFDALGELDATLQPPITTLRLQNEKRDGLGKPLPSGTISVFEPGEKLATLILAGEKALQDTPVGLPVEIELGSAMDVWVQPTAIEDKTLESVSARTQQAKIVVRFGNDKPVPVLIEYLHPAAEDIQIVAESKRHTMKEGDPMWTFRLKPGQRAALEYTVRRAD